MPNLQQVMTAEVGDALFRASGAWPLRARRVVGVRLATGAPCSSHAEVFAPWPGPQSGVKRWFALDSGEAVGIEESGDTVKVQVWDKQSDPS